MLKTAMAGALVLSGLACLTYGAGALAAVSVGAAQAGPAALPAPVPGGIPPASGGIPPAMLVLYKKADATQCPQMPWQILAAIGDIESGNGTSDLPGVSSGSNYAGAEGPMQFLPATFAAYDMPVPPGGASPPSPYDPTDAVYAAARLLCADGAAHGDYEGAIFAYNHSAAYVTAVWSLALSYGGATAGRPAAEPETSPAQASKPAPGAAP